jgi:hypothetical protein
MIAVKTIPPVCAKPLVVTPRQALVVTQSRLVVPKALGLRAARPLARTVPIMHVLPTRLAAFPLIDDEPQEVRVNPYVEFSGLLTLGGGIRLTYRDLDTRFFLKLCHFLYWAASTGAVAWWLFTQADFAPVTQWVALAVAAVAFGYLFFRAKEIARTIEIRADCMILDGADVFWLDRMELGWPDFERDADANLVLQGVYGTRFIEYFTVRRFDEFDHSPEVLEARVLGAMQQLWSGPGRDR